MVDLVRTNPFHVVCSNQIEEANVRDGLKQELTMLKTHIERFANASSDETFDL